MPKFSCFHTRYSPKLSTAAAPRSPLAWWSLRYRIAATPRSSDVSMSRSVDSRGCAPISSQEAMTVDSRGCAPKSSHEAMSRPAAAPRCRHMKRWDVDPRLRPGIVKSFADHTAHADISTARKPAKITRINIPKIKSKTLLIWNIFTHKN